MTIEKLFVNSLHLTDKGDRMTKEEFFDIYYPGLRWEDLSESCRMLQNALWESYDNGIIKDNHIFKTAYHICVQLYNRLKGYEDQIINDIDELNGKHGTPVFSLETIDRISALLQDMAFICETYHKYFEAFNDSTIETVAKMANEKPIYQENAGKSVEQSKSDVYCNENEMINLRSDQDPAHGKWFVKVLNSKIPIKPNKDRDHILYENLNKLYKELCDSDYLNPNEEDKSVFIYRFSGLKGPFSPERKIEWKGDDIFLGYIVRCLISDERNVPMSFITIASFFYATKGTPIHLASAKYYEVRDFEKEKKCLPLKFISAVELLRKCGFANVEFTSSRR